MFGAWLVDIKESTICTLYDIQCVWMYTALCAILHKMGRGLFLVDA